MPNPITYNGGTAVSGNLNRNGLAVGVNSLDFGSSPGGKTWYTGIEPEGFLIYSNTYSQGSTTQGNGRPTAWGTSDTSDAGLLSLINSLPVREGLAKFADLSSAVTWLEGTGNYIIVNKSYPNIVTSNLKSLTDASFTASYPRTGTTCYDMSGNANNGTLYNGPTLNSSAGYFQFDGTDDYMAIPTPGSTGSIQFTYYWTGLPQKVITGNLGGYAMLYNGGSGVVIHWYPASGTYDFGGNLPSRAGWYNIAVTWNGTSDNKMYMNGALVMSSTSYSISKPPIWYFAGNHYSAQAIRIQSILTYDKVLSQAEVLQNQYRSSIVTDSLSLFYDPSNIVCYQNGDSSAYNLYGTSSSSTNGTLSISTNGTLTNGVAYSQTRGGCWDFDGTDDWIQIPTYTFGNGNWTVNMWVNADTTTDYSILSNSSGGPVSNAFGFQSAKIAYRNYDGAWQARLGNTTLSAGNWYMLTWVNYAGASAAQGTIQMFVNGISDSSIFNSYTTNGGPCDAIGRNWFSYYNGRIGSVQFYTKSLSQAEITQNFNAQRNRFGI